MSCSICLLPFVPASRSIAPRPPPPGILTPQQDAYLRLTYGLGTRIIGILSPYDYLDNNMFGNGSTMMFLQWEGESGTFFMMHTTCCNILRRVFRAEKRSNKAGMVRLLEIEEVLGRPQAGIHAGRLNFVPYEEAGDPVDRVDVRQFWKPGHGVGLNVFLWEEFAKSDAQWTLAKPDVFPRFFPQVKQERLDAIGEPVAQPGVLTQQPLDVLLVILPYLSLPAYIALTSTCRLLRHHALTTFQPHARTRVLALGWATPLLALGEYDSAVKRNASAAQTLVHPKLSPATGDWLLYLSHVHRTASMRARRRIWNISVAIQATVANKLPSTNYGQNIDIERPKLEGEIGIFPETMGNLKGMDAASIRKMAEELIPREQWRSLGIENFLNGRGL